MGEAFQTTSQRAQRAYYMAYLQTRVSDCFLKLGPQAVGRHVEDVDHLKTKVKS
jgi:hypothetical protein